MYHILYYSPLQEKRLTTHKITTTGQPACRYFRINTDGMKIADYYEK